MRKIYQAFTLSWTQDRIYGLDILRALAITSVVLGHGNAFFPPVVGQTMFHFLPDGVSVFFVLSGFLIGGILIKTFENEYPTARTLSHFWLRRWFRTLPSYYLFLIILVGLSYIFTSGFNIGSVKGFIVFCQNFAYPHPVFFVEAWSLSVEEWFYILMPVLLFVSTRVFGLTTKKAFIWLCFFILLVSVGIRYYRYMTIEIIDTEIFDLVFRKQVITRLDSITFGVFGAYLAFYYPIFWVRYKNFLFIAGISLFVVSKVLSEILFPGSAFYFCNISFILIACYALLILPYLSQLKGGRGLLYRLLTSLSLVSYSMYLIHATFIEGWVLKFIVQLPISVLHVPAIQYFLYWLFTIAGSILLYKYFELPFMSMREKLQMKKNRVQNTAV